MSSKIIPSERLSAVRKLDLADLTQANARPSTQPRALTAEAVDPGVLQRACDEAFAKGRQAGRQEVEHDFETQRAELQTLIAGINELMRDFEQTLANDVLSMGLELAKLIVLQSLRVKPELVLGVIREAVTSLPGLSDHTTLVLNPLDAVLVRKLTEHDASLAELSWKIVEDSQLERGGCRLETPTTEVDAALETRWRRILAALGRDDAWIDITT